MKIWLDDLREAPDSSWMNVKNDVALAFHFIKNGVVEEISLDHDLGEGRLTGYDLLKLIESKFAQEPNYCKLPVFTIHSANPVGRRNMERAITSIYKLAKRNERQ